MSDQLAVLRAEREERRRHVSARKKFLHSLVSTGAADSKSAAADSGSGSASAAAAVRSRSRSRSRSRDRHQTNAPHAGRYASSDARRSDGNSSGSSSSSSSHSQTHRGRSRERTQRRSPSPYHNSNRSGGGGGGGGATPFGALLPPPRYGSSSSSSSSSAASGAYSSMMIPPVVAPASAAAISILPSATPVMAGGTPMIAPINLPINLSDGSAPAPIGNTLAIVSGVAKELAAKEVVSTLLHQNGQIYNPHPRFYPPNVNKTLAVVAAHQTAASSSSSSAAAAASSPHGNGYEQHRRSGGGTAANGTGDADGGDIVGASGTITQSAALNAANQYKDENEKEPPKNDYSQHFVDTSQRPQNYIRDADVNDRFQEYPKLRELIMLKNDMIRRYATPPMYLNCDLKTFDLSQLGTKFDVILIDPPWEEYRRRAPGATMQNMAVWNERELLNLRIDLVANSPSFVFLWVGSAEGLRVGRDMIRQWGFRRCEDIAWVKTNRKSPDDQSLKYAEDTIFQATSEHCLVGIKGTVRRSTDGHLIHANVDTDVIVSETPAGQASTRKPEELYDIIERFALGRRRLELFGVDHNIRPGWVTLGNQLTTSNFDRDRYVSHFRESHLLENSPQIDKLRPKSPPRGEPGAPRGGGPGGRGGPRGRGGPGRGRGRGGPPQHSILNPPIHSSSR